MTNNRRYLPTISRPDNTSMRSSDKCLIENINNCIRHTATTSGGHKLLPCRVDFAIHPTRTGGLQLAQLLD